MGAAAYRRGSRVIAREADAGMEVANKRADLQAEKDELARLRSKVAELERINQRAAKVVALLSAEKTDLREQIKAKESSYQFSVKILGRLAYRHERLATDTAPDFLELARALYAPEAFVRGFWDGCAGTEPRPGDPEEWNLYAAGYASGATMRPKANEG